MGGNHISLNTHEPDVCHNIGMRLVTSDGDGDLMYMVGRSRILNSYGGQFVSRDRYSSLIVICIMLPTYIYHFESTSCCSHHRLWCLLHISRVALIRLVWNDGTTYTSLRIRILPVPQSTNLIFPLRFTSTLSLFPTVIQS